MEPRTSLPKMRLKAVETLAKAGIPTGVLVAPVIPGLTEHEMPQIIAQAGAAGAQTAGFTIIRLAHGLADLFSAWVESHFPDRKAKILKRIREMHGGKMHDSRFGVRMSGEGFFAEQIKQIFALACRKNGLDSNLLPLSTAAFQKPQGPQMKLFG